MKDASMRSEVTGGVLFGRRAAGTIILEYGGHCDSPQRTRLRRVCCPAPQKQMLQRRYRESRSSWKLLEDSSSFPC